MLRDADVQAFLNELDKILNVLMKQGLLPKDANRNQIKENVLNTLRHEPGLTIANVLSSPETRLFLALACMDEAKPNPSREYRDLFRFKPGMRPTLKRDLQELFKDILELKLKNDPTGKKQKQLEKYLDELEKIFEKELSPDHKESLNKNLLALELLKKILKPKPEPGAAQTSKEQERLQRDQRIATYGIDTHNPGSVLRALGTAIYGNMSGFQDLATFGDSFMATYNNPESGKADSLGVRLQSIMGFIADGIDTPFEANVLQKKVRQELDLSPAPTSGFNPTPFPTKPTPEK